VHNTIFIGKVYYCFDELPSTNDYASEMLDISTGVVKNDQIGRNAVPSKDSTLPPAKSRPAEGTVIRAASQSAGRGQFGSRWESAAGQNLTLSVILYPVWLPANRQFFLSMVAALAVRDVLCHLRDTVGGATQQIPVKVKWPNDVYIGSRKCAGILIQNTLADARLQASVIGIGLNINQMQFSSDARQPVSAAMAFGKEFDLDDVLSLLCSRLEQRYMQLKAGGQAAIRALYESQLYRRGEKVTFEYTQTGTHVEGEITGVSESGHLRVKTDTGVLEFEVKEVTVV
jgi:BirA family transcriptional regulator, biotin operon repressor / biotin---[acetyl-CoA-carboxylase] ligase